jgi:chromosome partitioning protein
MNVVAVFNQKGGVGKTTISVNLAVTLASLGYSTIFLDLDFQGDGTRQLWHADAPARTVYDILARRCAIDEAAVATGHSGLSVVASSRKLSLIEAGADTAGWRQTEIKECGFARTPADFLIIDCPPALGRLAANALTAADFLVIPVTPSPFAIEGMKRTLEVYEAVRAGLNPNLRRYSVCISMMDDRAVSRVLASEIVLAQVEHLLPTKVPFDAEVNRAAARAMPAVLFSPQSAFAQSIISLAGDVIGTLGLELTDSAIEAMRERIAARHRDLGLEPVQAAEVKDVPATGAVPALVAGATYAAAAGAYRVKPFVVGSLIGAALGFFAGAHM